MSFEDFVFCLRNYKSSPAQAHEYAIKNGISELIDYSECTTEPIRSAWYTSILMYDMTWDKNISLYERCRAERRMRAAWREFESLYVYKEPSVPELPH